MGLLGVQVTKPPHPRKLSAMLLFGSSLLDDGRVCVAT